MLTLRLLPIKGNYTLVMFLEASSHVKVAKLGRFNLQKGYYIYNGSALGNNATSLRHRVARHLQKRKNRRWHIDYLLEHRRTSVMAVVAATSNVNKECEITRRMQRIEGAVVPIIGFGASDCRHKCKSHLVYFKEVKLETIADTYKQVLGDVKTLITISPRSASGEPRSASND